MADDRPAPEPKTFAFEWKGLLIAMIKAQGLHAGIWRLQLHFMPIMAANFKTDAGPMPGAMVGVQGIELVEHHEVGPFAADAAIVNPEARILMPAGGFN